MRFLPRREAREEELAALADGSLTPDRRAALEARVDDSPELAARLAEQRRAVAAVRGAAASVSAPADLRARVSARPQSVRRRRYVWAGGVVLAAVAVLVLVLALPGNVPGGPTVAEAALVAARPATEPAPRASSTTLLARDVEGVAFPNWARKFGWKATGLRVDTVDRRRVTTVFYEKGGRRLGYAIVAGSALREPDANVVRRDGTELRVLTLDGRNVVTWLRRGRTCILVGAGVDTATLTKLAAWKGKGTVVF